MKILYYIDGMHYGGAAKKLAMLSEEFIRRGHEVHIATNLYIPIGFEISENTHLHSLYLKDSYSRSRTYRLINVIKSARKIAQNIRPDIIVSVIPHVSLFVRIATLGIGIPVVFSDETSFARKDSLVDYIVRRHLYYFASAVTILTNNDARLLGRRIPHKVVIHNPVSVKPISNDTCRTNTIIAVGPLSEWEIKGFDLLFAAFSGLKDDFPDWKLVLVGTKDEGSEKKVLELAYRYGVADSLELKGFDPNIVQQFRQSSVFALSSRIEGFSLSLVEAMSQGCACVAFRISGVIEEVTYGGKGVVLVEDGDVEGFKDGLRKCMSDRNLRDKMAIEGIECSKNYDLNAIASKWEALFNRLTQKKS